MAIIELILHSLAGCMFNRTSGRSQIVTSALRGAARFGRHRKCETFGRGVALLLFATGGLDPAIAHDASDCDATLTLPAADLSLAFPQSFSWTSSGPCQNAQLAFATSG